MNPTYFYGELPETISALQSFIFRSEIDVVGFTPEGDLTENIDVPGVIPFYEIEIVGQNGALFNWPLYTDGDRFISPNLDCPPPKNLVQAILYQLGHNPDCFKGSKLWKIEVVNGEGGKQIQIRPWRRALKPSAMF